MRINLNNKKIWDEAFYNRPRELTKEEKTFEALSEIIYDAIHHKDYKVWVVGTNLEDHGGFYQKIEKFDVIYVFSKSIISASKPKFIGLIKNYQKGVAEIIRIKDYDTREVETVQLPYALLE